ncbi:hypothetical protein KSS87_013990 [Heliosperma pusillum]|nr:hypothetical protein KSS87_013990 [Heliosperma pusillum]
MIMSNSPKSTSSDHRTLSRLTTFPGSCPLHPSTTSSHFTPSPLNPTPCTFLKTLSSASSVAPPSPSPLDSTHPILSTTSWWSPSHRVCTSPWVKLSPGVNFDDIVVYDSETYAVDREGCTRLIIHYKTITRLDMGRIVAYVPGCGSDKFRWRKRFADDGNLYLVVRTEEKSFRVFMLDVHHWVEVRGFEGNKVLFMARDYYFFLRASRKFPGREYKNCIVFSEAAFPQLGDRVFAREGEISGFPKIDWSPPSWILNVSSVTADESGTWYATESEREPDEDEGWDSDSTNKNDGEMQSDLKDSNSKDEEEQEDMESDFDCQHQVDGKMQCDLNSQEKEDEQMIKGDASLQEEGTTEVVMPSLSTVEKEVRRTLLVMNSGNDAIEGETSRKNINHSIAKASTSAMTESHKSDSATTKFEGLDIRSDLDPSLHNIWRKHGNIIKDSILRSAEIVARALESLATMVRILEDNLAQSLSDSQADYLSSTLSDLKCIRFKVYWLSSFVDKALKIHKTKFNDEENKLNEAMGKVSKMLPFCGQVKFDEPVGAGLA